MLIFHLYGFFIGLGILVGTWVAEKFRKFLNTKYSILNASIYDLLPWVLLPAIIGARIYHVLDYWQYYAKNPIEILFLWQGGLGIYGGIFGGMIGVWLFCWKLPITHFKKALGQKLKDRVKLFLSLLDLVAVGLPLGQAISRAGNYFNQELYGLPTNLPWGIYIRPENRLLGFETFTKFHPLFAYEAIWDLIIFITIIIMIKIIGRKKSKPGSFFFLYLGLYAFGRFWLEFLRINPWQIIGTNVAQGISVGLMLISLIWLIRQICYHRKI